MRLQLEIVGQAMKSALTILFLLVGLSCQPTGKVARSELMKVENDFAAAVLNNNAEAISKFVSDDWVIIDADGRIVEKARFLDAIKSGALVHDEMELDDMTIRTHGNDAVVTTITSTKGKFMGREFSSQERATDVFVRRNGRWQCVFSQLTPFNVKEKSK